MTPGKRRMTQAATAVAAVVVCAQALRSQAVHPPPSAPSSLKTVSVPKPDLSAYVANQTALIQLGKTLFWDMQMGSDGIQACASCHFHAGADHRVKNSLNPGTNANPSLTWFTSGDFNNTVAASDYPFHRFSNPADKNSAVVYDQPARTGSQGVFLFHFLSVIPGSALDNGTVLFDDTFQIGGANIRRVEPRNTPRRPSTRSSITATSGMVGPASTSTGGVRSVWLIRTPPFSSMARA